VKFFKLYPRGREAKMWGSIGAFTNAKSQSMATIFLALDHTGGVHNASMTGGNRPLGTDELVEFET
jgi:hypothetical protein